MSLQICARNQWRYQRSALHLLVPKITVMSNVYTFKTALLSSEELILKRTIWMTVMIVQGCAKGVVSYSCVQPLL